MLLSFDEPGKVKLKEFEKKFDAWSFLAGF